ncbi:tRNA lysidine(34) synthetase TilS [Amphiplicatus metriothermophilus]|uniref:tRNA(Ile)-lysidine synthase n=1 Tax=Amphiplicatus metriothermophilus TaxID=1519374 RepID=A0A239PYF5_9PROT|nr:tRNA lysidine(34) synthetase TilS [Amphiplicatus metriothermophilus]MBB5518179.1 tRNA(Ile)-lysidine synthase [Amphiplicatus metriothermophilus]SNT75341.1 tRNA(Ile)-lysidine synthase [Amphiplicatus metriothermophilus]
MPAPLDLDFFCARLSALGAPRRYIVAVSGGPDSMTLARLAAAHQRRGAARVLAVTVDHGLRPESRAEAAQAGDWCRAAGLDHRILVWEGEKPTTGLQQAARRARYRLLAAQAAANGFEAVLTAHTADDQAETVFMRLARGAGPAGLAGMAARKMIAAGAAPPVALLRPFLDVSRARARATLESFGQPWIDDPSNDDPAFERVRARALLAALEEQNLLTGEALRRTAARARAASLAMRRAEEDAFARAGGCFYAGGWASVRAEAAAEPGFEAVAARLVRAVSGGDYAPSPEDAAAALAAARASGAATLGGALLKRRGPALFFLREPAALLGRAGVAPAPALALAPGGRALWDGRFIAENSGGETAQVAALGPEGLAALGPARALFDAPEEALLAAPAALFRGKPGLRLVPLAEERFYDRILRFPDP